MHQWAFEDENLIIESWIAVHNYWCHANILMLSCQRRWRNIVNWLDSSLTVTCLNIFLLELRSVRHPVAPHAGACFHNIVAHVSQCAGRVRDRLPNLCCKGHLVSRWDHSAFNGIRTIPPSPLSSPPSISSGMISPRSLCFLSHCSCFFFFASSNSSHIIREKHLSGKNLIYWSSAYADSDMNDASDNPTGHERPPAWSNKKYRRILDEMFLKVVLTFQDPCRMVPEQYSRMPNVMLPSISLSKTAFVAEKGRAITSIVSSNENGLERSIDKTSFQRQALKPCKNSYSGKSGVSKAQMRLSNPPR